VAGVTADGPGGVTADGTEGAAGTTSGLGAGFAGALREGSADAAEGAGRAAGRFADGIGPAAWTTGVINAANTRIASAVAAEDRFRVLIK
ncbi:MAG TPA: hypothetical protein VM821_07885, partial [Abditibacteriaceae bacterium]|nr:hypothetical protein [Abditibacteriaceae bacterium]